MTPIQRSIYALLICAIICGLAAIMETYKKVIRKDKSKRFENIVVGLILTSASVGLLIASGILEPILGILGAPLWADHLMYTLGIFLLQLNVNMTLVKKVVKVIVTNMLKRANLTDEQINDIFSAVNK